VCGDSAADFLRDLESDPRSLDVAVRQALATRPPGSKIVLVIDQLEELFTLCTDDATRHRFLDAVVDVASASDAPTVIVLALRADFLGHFATNKELARLLERHTLLIGPMDEPGLRDAIEGPARVAGLSLEPGLADVILRDVAGQPGGLPLLSHALLEVWSRRSGHTLTIAGYQASGGVSGAIARSADALYEGLNPAEQRIARGMFVRLTELAFPSLGPFSAASVSPDGGTLVTGDGSRMMRWNIDSDQWRTTACAVAGRNLTRAEWEQYLPKGERYRATCPEHPESPT
jgi:hypothetical protein